MSEKQRNREKKNEESHKKVRKFWKKQPQKFKKKSFSLSLSLYRNSTTKKPHLVLLVIFVGKLVGMGYTHPILFYYLVNIISIYKFIFFSLFIVHCCFIFLYFCVYISLFIFMFILLLFVLCCCAFFSRWILDHLLRLAWEVPLGGRNLIPPRHLGIFTILPFNLCHPFYFPSNPIFPLIYVILFYFLSNPLPFLFMSSILFSK